MYNGITDPSILGVDNYKNGIISKGVLIDVPLLHNKEYVEAGYKVLKDILLVRFLTFSLDPIFCMLQLIFQIVFPNLQDD